VIAAVGGTNNLSSHQGGIIMMSTRVARFTMAALMVAALAFAAHAGEALKKVTFAVGGDGFHMSTLHLAIDGDFMAAEGLEGEIIDVQSNSRQAAAVMGGSVDFATMGMVHVMKSHAQGGTLEAVCMLFKSLDITLVIANDAAAKKGITPDMPLDEKIKRLEGLRIAVTSPGSSTDTVVRTFFVVRGMDPDKVINIQPVGSGASMLAAFEASQVDGFAVSAPHVQVAVQKGLGFILANPLTGEVPEMKDIPYLSLVTSSDSVKKRPELIRSMTRAFTRAMLFAKENPDGARAIMRKHFDKIDDALFDEIWNTYKLGIPASPVITRDQMERAVNWLNLTSVPPVEVSFDDVAAAGYDISSEAAAEILGK
jgi:NitT/TauT family transport system substrate-binding protein